MRKRERRVETNRKKEEGKEKKRGAARERDTRERKKGLGRERAAIFDREPEREKCDFGAGHQCLELGDAIGEGATLTLAGLWIQCMWVSYFYNFLVILLGY